MCLIIFFSLVSELLISMHQYTIQTQELTRTYPKYVDLEHIRATFNQISKKTHEVVVEINSNKFLISIKAGLSKLESFEIVAVKWFIHVCVKTIQFLRKLVSSLYFEH